jgi:aminopeptidase N
MRDESPRPVRLAEYRPPAFLVDDVFLEVELDPNATRVRGRLSMRRNPAYGEADAPLVLDGEKLELEAVRLDGEPLSPNRYQVDDRHLTVADVPDAFTLETVSRCDPQANTALSGLYLSNGIFCTQCEAEGFRRITWFPDRPDVMATYRTRIVAPDDVPVLLSNGNCVETGRLADGRHFAEWRDPFRKPSYLFALVAGRLGHVEDRFTTASGRDVTLRIFVEPGNEPRCAYAMDALKRAMRWDEERFGREYDLDIFMIVAVSAFNMGAMENKGLNVFNDKYILADPSTATDADYAGIETVVAHEYFHNWTGNRITCRDWFQLCLKEGLTVFRDQEFTSDLHSRAVKRIEDVRTLRARQFPEDQGPLAHAVRPDSYIEINNFYTPTIYEKGAEIVRMIATLAGRERFRAGMDCYFARHDGEAATVEQFLAALADGSGLDLSRFPLWYAQSGTPRVEATGVYDPAERAYALTLTQSCPATPGQPAEDKQPVPIPVAVGLVGPDGADLPLRLDGEAGSSGTTRVLALTERTRTFRFRDVAAPPVPSLLRGFSAPVQVSVARSAADWRLLMTHDSDPFNRWEAVQTFATERLIVDVAALRGGSAPDSHPELVEAFAALLADGAGDPSFAALALTLPGEATIAQAIGRDVDTDAIHAAREALRAEIGDALRAAFRETYARSRPEGPYSPDAEQAGLRALRNASLAYLVAAPGGEGVALALNQFAEADNMTDQIAALGLVAHTDCAERQATLDSFEARWRSDPLVLDKWFAVQATAPLAGTLDRVMALRGHPAFSMANPNRVRALIGSFAANPVGFNAGDGAGYRFVANAVRTLDAANPQVAARLLGAFRSWRQMEPVRQAHMRAALEEVAGTEGLSRDVYEIATRTLA